MISPGACEVTTAEICLCAEDGQDEFEKDDFIVDDEEEEVEGEEEEQRSDDERRRKKKKKKRYLHLFLLEIHVNLLCTPSSNARDITQGIRRLHA